MRRLALAALILLVAATPAFGGPSPIAKKKHVDAQISTLQSRLSSQKRQEQALRNQVSDYTTRIRALEARVGDVSLRLQTLEADLSLHEHRLAALNALYRWQTRRFVFLTAQVRRATSVLSQRIVAIYESDDPSTLDVFLGSGSIQDAVDKVQYLDEIAAQDRAIAAEVAASKRRVAHARARTKRLRASLRGETAVIASRTAQERSVRDELVGARNDLSTTKDRKLVDLSQLSAAEQAEASEIDALQQASQALGDQIRAAQARSSGPTQTPSTAGLVWPVQGPITSPFGWRWGRMHEGIDIGVGTGTPIHAAAAGTVIYCGWESGYGNLVVLDHGGNLATAYGHQSSIAVACGQHVDQGQVIGYVGCTGHCTGPHLHFEVRVGGNPVDPLGYL